MRPPIKYRVHKTNEVLERIDHNQITLTFEDVRVPGKVVGSCGVTQMPVFRVGKQAYLIRELSETASDVEIVVSTDKGSSITTNMSTWEWFKSKFK
jgi:hypothetical protein